jgi:hypothetical protein
MNVRFIPIASLLILSLFGCVTSMPQSPAEFRRVIPGSFMGNMDAFEVNRPLHDVASTFKARSAECLNVTVKSTSKSRSSIGTIQSSTVVTRYKSTVVAASEQAELHVQFHHESGVVGVHKEPAGGNYLMIVDAVPLDKSRTKITMYHPKFGYDALVTGVKGWATGKSAGCPDMSTVQAL